ncbi:hypothetical protein FNJ47_28955 [Bradyrhizobium sp. UFLA 03-164]|uniref:Uncharacterized protein n=1 Tax=Bradyrhizobium uaiense TaxID=2594946 RepID=A0A6P1BNE7_9BRAD|nr:hypothetical protein [Bradyrhizobium uaiense]
MRDGETVAVLRAVLDEVCSDVPRSDTTRRTSAASGLLQAVREGRSSIEELRRAGRAAQHVALNVRGRDRCRNICRRTHRRNLLLSRSISLISRTTLGPRLRHLSRGFLCQVDVRGSDAAGLNLQKILEAIARCWSA